MVGRIDVESTYVETTHCPASCDPWIRHVVNDGSICISSSGDKCLQHVDIWGQGNDFRTRSREVSAPGNFETGRAYLRPSFSIVLI
jgi:hypothetical protein